MPDFVCVFCHKLLDKDFFTGVGLSKDQNVYHWGVSRLLLTLACVSVGFHESLSVSLSELGLHDRL